MQTPDWMVYVTGGLMWVGYEVYYGLWCQAYLVDASLVPSVSLCVVYHEIIAHLCIHF